MSGRGLYDHIETITIIDCSRCANQAQYYGINPEFSIDYFDKLGWQVEGNRVYCPGCKGDLYPG